jgi:transcriptional regulator with XRE-family HTH domain
MFAEMEARRRALRMSRPALARRSGVSLPTVNRILSGKHEAPTLPVLTAIAEALGMELRLRPVAKPEVFAERQAREVARKVVRLVQGTSGLEGQAVDPPTLRRLERRTEQELLAGSPRRLWGDL